MLVYTGDIETIYYFLYMDHETSRNELCRFENYVMFFNNIYAAKAGKVQE